MFRPPLQGESTIFPKTGVFPKNSIQILPLTPNLFFSFPSFMQQQNLPLFSIGHVQEAYTML
jgi:hypothetical protein